jgi:hypothetical protein
MTVKALLRIEDRPQLAHYSPTLPTAVFLRDVTPFRRAGRRQEDFGRYLQRSAERQQLMYHEMVSTLFDVSDRGP